MINTKPATCAHPHEVQVGNPANLSAATPASVPGSAKPEPSKGTAPALPDQDVHFLGTSLVEELLDLVFGHRLGGGLETRFHSGHRQGEHHQNKREQQHQECGHDVPIIPYPGLTDHLIPGMSHRCLWQPGPVSRVAVSRVAVPVAPVNPAGGKPASSVISRRKIAAPATALARTRRARRISAELALGYPEAHCELDFSDPLELAVATILSAQCTDVRVNMVTPALFARYRTAADYAGADRAELESLIRTTGFFRNKANSIIGLGRQLLERFDGELPRTLAELVTLPGFGRKTANVVLGNAFDTPGITVDTHMRRLVTRWGLTTDTDPVRIEHQLNAMLPSADWTRFSHRVIYHGRRVCQARRPACGACFLSVLCPAYGTGPTDPVLAATLVVGPEREHLLELAGLGVPADVRAGAVSVESRLESPEMS